VVGNTKRPAKSVAVIGAGISGITCAAALTLHVDRVTVYEKHLYAGGRMASRRIREYDFDIGTQYFTVQEETFRSYVYSWEQDDLIRPWQGWFVDLEHGNMISRGEDAERFVAVPNMAALVRHLARLCNVQYNCAIQKLERTPSGWYLLDIQGAKHGPYEFVLSSMPAPETRLLFSDYCDLLYKKIQAVQMSCCWGLALGFQEALPVPFDVGFVNDQQLSLVARVNSKPGRTDKETWIVQAAPEWSDTHFDSNDQAIVPFLEAAFADAIGVNVPAALVRSSFLWPYSTPITPVGKSCLYDSDERLGACGDWCMAPRVEGAFLSGLALAEQVLDDIEQ
jgi:renalase